MENKAKPPIGLDELDPSQGSPAAVEKPGPAFDDKGLAEIARAPFWLIALFTGVDAWNLTDSEAQRIGTVLAPLADKYLNEWAKTHQAEIVAAIAIAGVTANKARAIRAEKEKRRSPKPAADMKIETAAAGGGGSGSIQAERDREIMESLKK